MESTIIKVTVAPYFLQQINQPTFNVSGSPKPSTADHNPVEPIRSREDIERIKDYFLHTKGHGNTRIRNYAYFILSINLARRAGDILSLHIYDVLDEHGQFKSHITIGHEQKTGKKSILPLDDNSREALTLYLQTRENLCYGDWLFPTLTNPDKPCSVNGMYMMLNRTVAELGLDIHIGTHTLRKTKPYHMIKAATTAEEEVMVSQFLGHNSVKTTYHYIGRSQEEMDAFITRHSI